MLFHVKNVLLYCIPIKRNFLLVRTDKKENVVSCKKCTATDKKELSTCTNLYVPIKRKMLFHVKNVLCMVSFPDCFVVQSKMGLGLFGNIFHSQGKTPWLRRIFLRF